MIGTVLTLVAVVALWVGLTLEGWGREAPATGGVSSRHPTLLGGGHMLALVLDPHADPRPIVGCVRRWDDLEAPAPCDACGAGRVAVVVRCRGPPGNADRSALSHLTQCPPSGRTYARRLSVSPYSCPPTFRPPGTDPR